VRSVMRVSFTAFGRAQGGAENPACRYSA